MSSCHREVRDKSRQGHSRRTRKGSRRFSRTLRSFRRAAHLRRYFPTNADLVTDGAPPRSVDTRRLRVIFTRPFRAGARFNSRFSIIAYMFSLCKWTSQSVRPWRNASEMGKILTQPAVRWETPRRSIVHGSLILVLCCACATTQHPIMTWAEYASLQRSGRHPEWPYILQPSTRRGALMYFGARHTFDPVDSQVARIQKEWQSFRPDIAFTEGGLPPMASTQDDAVRNAGEPGLVRFLAARDNVPTTTLDPSTAEEVAALSRAFSREQIKLFFVLRGVSQYLQRAGDSGLELESKRILGVFSTMPGLSGSPGNIEELQAAYRRSFPGAASYQEVQPSWFDPVVTATFFNDISRASSEYRDAYIVRLLTQHVSDGQRVFAVVGGSHVVMQERALLARLRSLK
jgi:hypothetical protein